MLGNGLPWSMSAGEKLSETKELRYEVGKCHSSTHFGYAGSYLAVVGSSGLETESREQILG